MKVFSLLFAACFLPNQHGGLLVHGFVAPRTPLVKRERSTLPPLYSQAVDPDPIKKGVVVLDDEDDDKKPTMLTKSAVWVAVLAAAAPSPLFGAAMWSYAHAGSVLCSFGAKVAQRTMIKPNLSKEDEELFATLNVVYGVSLALLIASGFVRVFDFEKGSYFYTHEVSFWIKMLLTGVHSGVSLFPTVTLLRRDKEAQEEGVFEPMSDKLVSRMETILTAEILGLLTIPLFGAFIARGIWYWNDISVEAAFVLAVLGTVGASFAYAKEAFTWEDEPAAGSLQDDGSEV